MLNANVTCGNLMHLNLRLIFVSILLKIILQIFECIVGRHIICNSDDFCICGLNLIVKIWLLAEVWLCCGIWIICSVFIIGFIWMVGWGLLIFWDWLAHGIEMVNGNIGFSKGIGRDCLDGIMVIDVCILEKESDWDCLTGIEATDGWDILAEEDCWNCLNEIVFDNGRAALIEVGGSVRSGLEGVKMLWKCSFDFWTYSGQRNWLGEPLNMLIFRLW